MSRSKELILLAQRIRALSQTGLVYSLSERGDGLGCASGPLAGRDGYEQASASRYTLLCI